jgi:uncharacterized protein
MRLIMEKKIAGIKYIELKRKIERLANHIETIHAGNINCKEGCSSCCINLSVFPFEFYGILYEMELDHFDCLKIEFDEKQTCGFLKNNLCQIYKYRPIICRTHGLPVSFINDDNPNEIFNEISFCELNFNMSPEKLEKLFDESNILDIDKINSELFRLNHESGHKNSERIQLKEILNRL